MKTTRNTSSVISRIRRWQTGKSAGFAPSGIVLFIVILLWIIGGRSSFSQGVGISEVSIVPNSTSILELQSTLRGFLAPRMTTAQRLAIATPANSLLVFDTDKKSFFYWESNSSTWKAIAATTLGSANFLYEIIEEIKESPDKKLDYEKEVKALEEMMMQEIEPFEPNGYNRNNVKK